MNYPASRFEHLLSMIGPYGVFEHAKHDRVRPEHGYCVDDVARVLLVAVREPERSDATVELVNVSLSFLKAAQSPDGSFKNRRTIDGVFVGEGSNDDCWGRAVWSLGTAVTHESRDEVRHEAMELLETSLRVRSPFARSMAFAALGATEVLRAYPTDEVARELVHDAVALLHRPVLGDDWRWPEEWLSYANAVLPEALMAVGVALNDDAMVSDGLLQLRWRLATQTTDTHLSVTSSKGRRRGARYERFDQQPIEVAALCDACARAWQLTGNDEWSEAIELCIQWFLGNNDLGEVMFDAMTGGGYDGLTANGPNRNQGAESTLALLATLQRAQQLEPAS